MLAVLLQSIQRTLPICRALLVPDFRWTCRGAWIPFQFSQVEMRPRDVVRSVLLGWSALKLVPKLNFYDSLCFILRKKRLLSCGVVLEVRFGLKVSCPSAILVSGSSTSACSDRWDVDSSFPCSTAFLAMDMGNILAVD
jgi:hypothetical protein